MTKTEVAVALKMPMSGNAEIDAIIRSARRLELMTAAALEHPYKSWKELKIMADTVMHHSMQDDS